MAEPERQTLPANAVRSLLANRRAFLSFLERRVGDHAVAEDILQEAFARGLGNVDSLRDDDAAVAWFYRTLRNAVVDHRRRRGARSRMLDAFAAELSIQGQADGEIRRNVCRCVLELAGGLKTEYADALRRVEVDAIAVKDYATEAGISSGNAAVRVFRARDALRKRVTSVCGVCAENGCLDCTCAPECGRT